MTNDGKYNCILSAPDHSGAAVAQINKEGLVFEREIGALSLDFSRLSAFHLINYHLIAESPDGSFTLSKMGRDTESLYENLWLAYNARVREALFAASSGIIEADGDYRYNDKGGNSQGTAKFFLQNNCLFILPAHLHARRVPLCFIKKMTLNNYTINIILDTGEEYNLIRLGRDTIPFFDTLFKSADEAQLKWKASHEKISKCMSAAPRESAKNYEQLKEICGEKGLIFGMFSSEDDASAAETPFWICGIKNGRAAVELITSGQSATYLYEFSGPAGDFEMSLRHAIESMGTHREIIFMEEKALIANPLYLMNLQRNYHLSFLRLCSSGRIIHTESWASKLKDFFR